MKIHIEGMGLLGSLVLLELAQQPREHTITWHDADVEHTAWKASTGAIYPCGAKDSVDWHAYATWITSSLVPDEFMEMTPYVFNHKSGPPHGGKYDYETDIASGLNIAKVPSMHLNAQRLVPYVRQRFAKLNKLPEYEPDVYIIAHGNGARRTHYYWGWTRLVQLKHTLPVKRRTCFYFRQGRFIMAYAYPVPGTQWWYSGSNIIQQTTARSLDMPTKYARWKHFFLELGNGAVSVTKEGAYLEGWRPAQKGLDTTSWDSWLDVKVRKNKAKLITLPPLWNSGIRHAPKVLSDLRKALA